MTDNGLVVPVPELREAVGQPLTMMADPNFTARQIVVVAGANGLSSITIRRLHGPDATFAEHAESTYRSQDFKWNGRYYEVDPLRRQLLVNKVIEASCEISMIELLKRLDGTRIDRCRVGVFSRPQRCGDAPVWEACVERRGYWLQPAPRSGRSIAPVTCPHCGEPATRVLRTPETAYGLLCRGCRRLPIAGSPEFPGDYFK